jgi:hypothetical protein
MSRDTFPPTLSMKLRREGRQLDRAVGRLIAVFNAGSSSWPKVSIYLAEALFRLPRLNSQVKSRDSQKGCEFREEGIAVG